MVGECGHVGCRFASMPAQAKSSVRLAAGVAARIKVTNRLAAWLAARVEAGVATSHMRAPWVAAQHQVRMRVLSER